MVFHDVLVVHEPQLFIKMYCGRAFCVRQKVKFCSAKISGSFDDGLQKEFPGLVSTCRLKNPHLGKLKTVLTCSLQGAGADNTQPPGLNKKDVATSIDDQVPRVAQDLLICLFQVKHLRYPRAVNSFEGRSEVVGKLTDNKFSQNPLQ